MLDASALVTSFACTSLRMIKAQTNQVCLSSGTPAWAPVPSTRSFPHRACFCLCSSKETRARRIGNCEVEMDVRLRVSFRIALDQVQLILSQQFCDRSCRLLGHSVDHTLTSRKHLSVAKEPR